MFQVYVIGFRCIYTYNALVPEPRSVFAENTFFAKFKLD